MAGAYTRPLFYCRRQGENTYSGVKQGLKRPFASFAGDLPSIPAVQLHVIGKGDDSLIVRTMVRDGA